MQSSLVLNERILRIKIKMREGKVGGITGLSTLGEGNLEMPDYYTLGLFQLVWVSVVDVAPVPDQFCAAAIMLLIEP